MDDAAETYTQDLLSEIATAHNSASNSLTTVQSLYKQAQNSSTAAMNVPLQQIQGTSSIQKNLRYIYLYCNNYNYAVYSFPP